MRTMQRENRRKHRLFATGTLHGRKGNGLVLRIVPEAVEQYRHGRIRRTPGKNVPVPVEAANRTHRRITKPCEALDLRQSPRWLHPPYTFACKIHRPELGGRREGRRLAYDDQTCPRVPVGPQTAEGRGLRSSAASRRPSATDSPPSNSPPSWMRSTATGTRPWRGASRKPWGRLHN